MQNPKNKAAVLAKEEKLFLPGCGKGVHAFVDKKGKTGERKKKKATLFLSTAFQQEIPVENVEKHPAFDKKKRKEKK